MHNDGLSKIESEDSGIDTDEIIEFHDNVTKKDESYRKARNHNILSHKEIKDLTKFFTKQTPLKILERLEGMKEHVKKLEYSGYLNDVKTLDTMKKYVKTKIRSAQPLKEPRRKTILKSVIMISQKVALYRRLSVNQSYSDLPYF